MNKTRKQIFDKVVDETSNYFGVDKELIIGDCRKRTLVDCRKAISYILYKTSEHTFSYPELAELMNKANHTTILYLVKKTEDLIMVNDRYFLKAISQIVYSIGDDSMMDNLISEIRKYDDSKNNSFKIQKFR